MIQLPKFIIVFMVGVLLVGAAIGAQPHALIPELTLGGIAYSNVMIESTSEKTVTFSHARGMASVNRLKLTFNEKVALGLVAPPPTNSIVSTNQFATNKVANLEPVRKTLDASREMEKYLREAGVSLKAAGVGSVVVYLFFGFCLLMICSKAGHPSRLLVFIPFLQVRPAYKAARMSPNWFRLLMVNVVLCLAMGGLVYTGHLERLPEPAVLGLAGLIGLFTLVHALGWIIWCFKICVAREKSPLIGIFLLLPCTQILALAYLAFSE